MVKQGSKWISNNGNDRYHVIHIIELEGHTWVHYIKENAPEDSTREYSCYIESFLSRFRALPE
jgi:hypothetical protein